MVQPGVSTQVSMTSWNDGLGHMERSVAQLGYTPQVTLPSQRLICTSINEVKKSHGIPNPSKLKDGDIVNIDVTPPWDGFHGDTRSSCSHPPGTARRLVGGHSWSVC